MEREGWNPEDLTRLNTFEDWRAPVLRATKRLHEKFYRQHFKGNERVLEVGSGTGFLRRAWPDQFKGEWVQLDAQSTFLDVAKKSIPGDSYVCASASLLPFPNESFDVVCGYSSYDDFPDLDKAIAETDRVLRKGGLFFHLIDLDPNIDQVLRDLERDHLPTMIRCKEGEDGYIQSQEISFVPREHLEEYERECEAISSEGDGEDLDGLLRKEREVWTKYGQEIQAHPFFEERLTSVLKARFTSTETKVLFSTFPAIKASDLTAVFRGPKTELQRKEPEFYTFVNEAGHFLVCKTPLQYYMLCRNFLQAYFNSFREYRHILYNWLLRRSPSLAQKIEPSSVEISTVRCVMARKIDF